MKEASGAFILDRMVRAVEKVRQRMLRCAGALEGAKVPYTVCGGNAVAAWVARVDEAAVRNTQDVDLLIRRSDLPAATQAMEAAGFVYQHAAGVAMFLDGADAKARDAVRVVFAGEKIREEYAEAAPDVSEAVPSPDGSFRHLSLAAMLRMKLTSNRRKDQVHVLDLIEVGLIDETWVQQLPEPLNERLQTLLADPDG